MKKPLFLTRVLVFLSFSMLVTFSIQAQIIQPNNLQPNEDYDNLKVKSMYSDSLVSTFTIWIKKGVKAHKHVHHTEQVQVLEGAAEMVLGNDTLFIQTGDWIVIPKNTIHAISKVYGNRPLKVISIQTPQYFAQDRVFIDEEMHGTTKIMRPGNK